MSEEKVELARSVAEMFNRREFNGFLALITAKDGRHGHELWRAGPKPCKTARGSARRARNLGRAETPALVPGPR